MGQPVPIPSAGQYGLTLIEVMVALVILSMGALGLAALQGLGTRYSTESYFRTQAILQAYDIVERMRANASAVSAGDYTAQSAAVDHGQDCTQQSCSTRELAVHDLAQWGARNSTLLPDGAGSVSADNAMLTVQITWRESRPVDGADEMKKLELSTRL